MNKVLKLIPKAIKWSELEECVMELGPDLIISDGSGGEKSMVGFAIRISPRMEIPD